MEVFSEENSDHWSVTDTDSEDDEYTSQTSQTSSDNFFSSPVPTNFVYHNPNYALFPQIKPKFKKLRRIPPPNLLQKLYNRELHGKFSAHTRAPNLRLFDKVPKSCQLRLRDVLPASAITNRHIFMGLTKCGQFLLTYTHSTDTDLYLFTNRHQYRLHWWVFVPHAPARKVAEVMLFGNVEVNCELYISICQWPMDKSKLIVHGTCLHSDRCSPAHAHFTLTAVPSLNRCSDCLKVAASYEEDDLAAVWDSCARLSCLKHGLTIHSNFEVVCPFPKFNPQVSLKRDGALVFNTGSFLHVVRATLEPANRARPQTQRPSSRLGDFLESTNRSIATTPRAASEIREEAIPEAVSDNSTSDKLWSNLRKDATDWGLASPRPPTHSADATSKTETGSTSPSLHDATSPPCSPTSPSPPTSDSNSPCTVITISSDEDASFQSVETEVSPPPPPPPVMSDRDMIIRDFSDEVFLGIRRLHIKHPRCDLDTEMNRYKAKRRRLTDDGASTCDEDAGNEEHSAPLGAVATFSPPVRRLPGDLFVRQERFLQEANVELQTKDQDKSPVRCTTKRVRHETTVYEFTDDAPPCEKLSSFRRRRLADKKYEFSEEGADTENIVPYRRRSPTLSPPARRPPDAPLGLDVGDQDKAVLRPLNRNIGLLSPRADVKPTVKKVLLTEVTVEQPQPTQQPPQPTNQDEPLAGKTEEDKFTRKYTRRYMEVEDELVSVITDIEDDESGEAPSYILALPMEVHGAGYTQLQMVSTVKAEKLEARGVAVHQMSLDVEAFCHDVAARMCDEADVKYCFCQDYDVEILDLCVYTGDVIVVAFMRILTATEKAGVTLREQYQGECTFSWNLDTGVHRVLLKAPLRDSCPVNLGGPKVTPHKMRPWGPARERVTKLNQTREPFPARHPVRCISNETTFTRTSYKSLADTDNLMEFCL